MCGIFGYIGNNKNSPRLVLEGIKSLEYRGYDSWGIATIDTDSDSHKIIVKKRIGIIGKATVDGLPKSSIALGHTRWATHGAVTEKNAHPHLDCTGELAIIHNGIIENYDELKKEVISDGHKLISKTDTEVAVHLIEQQYKKLLRDNHKNVFIEAVRLSFNKFVGLNAIIVMDAVSQTFVAAKTGSPLVIGKGKGENFLASDAHAILPHTKNLYFMEDGELISITPDNITVYNALIGSVKDVKFMRLNWEVRSVIKGKYPHYMIKEIYEQPQVIRNILSENQRQIDIFANLIKKSFGTYLIGCGTAAYACLAGSYIFSKIAQIHINWAQASEFGYTTDFLTSKSFVIALSQSGETIDVVEAVKKAQDKNSVIGALVNVFGSTLFRMSTHKIILGAGTEKAVVSTKAFTAKLTYLILLAHTLNKTESQGRMEIQKSVLGVTEVLSNQYLQKFKKLVDKISKYKDIYVIGRGISYPIALETALKIKEASYIHAEGFAAGELKHGVIALIERGIPCISFLPNDETYGATLAGTMEMKARGGYIIGVSFKQHEIFDYYLPVQDCGIATIIPAIVVGQLLGYYLAVNRGLDPDRPRNLAKSVVVK